MAITEVISAETCSRILFLRQVVGVALWILKHVANPKESSYSKRKNDEIVEKIGQSRHVCKKTSASVTDGGEERCHID